MLSLNSITDIDKHMHEKLTLPYVRRILIIDDEPFNVIAIQLAISRVGMKGLSKYVDRAYNGLEALKKVKSAYQNGNQVYGLIITDLSMPVMDGYEFVKEVRAFY